MKLLLLSVGSVLASSSSKLSSLDKACGKDYHQLCKPTDNVVTGLACGKSNQAALSPACVAEIQKDFPAMFACVEDLSTYCPSFGKMGPSRWRNDNDDDDDDDGEGRKRKGSFPRHSPPASSQPVPPASAESAAPPPPLPPVQSPKPDVLPDEVAPADSAPVSEDYYDYFVFEFSFDTQETATTTSPSSNMNALHSRTGPQEAEQCFVKNYPAFSATCLNAIAEQWAAEQTAQGAKTISAPSAEEAYTMMAFSPPPIFRSQKINRTLFYIALAFFACTLVTCLCCCCRRCKKRRSTRVVPTEGAQEMALTPLPEAVAVPMDGPTRYVPLAVPVAPVVRPQAPAYIPYTGEGLHSYVPVAQPVHV